MGYQNVKTPRFYIDYLSYLQAVGGYDLNPTSPTDFKLGLNPVFAYTTTLDTGAIIYLGTVGGDAIPKALPLNFAAILGHNYGGVDKQFNISFTFKDGSGGVPNLQAIANSEEGASAGHFVSGLNGFSVVELKASDNFDSSHGNEAISVIMLYTGTQNVSASFKTSSFALGKYYDMPHSPDLSLSMSHSYEGIKTTQTKGGVTLSNANYHKPSKWGDLEAWELKPSSGSYSADLGYRYSGRRSWDLSFSYISDTDLEPYNYSGIEYTQDTGGGGYGAGTDNWFTNVLYYTMGGHLPFIFCPDPSIEYTAQQDETYLYPRTPEFAICRLDMDSFKRDQVASNVYNIKIKIVESW